MRWRKDDVISILAITSSAALGVGLTAAFLLRAPADPVPVEFEFPTLTVQHVPLVYGPTVPDGYRPVTIEVDYTSSVARLAPGARVYVRANYETLPGKHGFFTQGFSKAMVLLAGERVQSVSADGETDRMVMTLLVPLRDADRLAAVATTPRSRFVLSPARDPLVPRKLTP